MMQQEIGDGCPGWKLICLQTTDSTNMEIRRRARDGALHGTVVAAEQQTAGRGRRGRSWDSPAGENLYFSILLFPKLPAEKVSGVTLVMALAVAQAVGQLCPGAQIKWPNDVVIDGKKVCGILTELEFLTDGSYYVIIGTGINVNGLDFPEEIRATATSLRRQRMEAEKDRGWAQASETGNGNASETGAGNASETAAGALVDREKLLASVLVQFAAYEERFERDGNLAGLRREYEELLANRGAAVKVLDPRGAWCGIAEGINDAGELLVRHEDGTLETVYAGEVSVRGIYGYV